MCRGQYHGWLKEKVGSHIVRRCNIHHCEQGGIIGRMGGVFSLIEDNHIHHINNMMELGGAEIAGIKMHAAIDVTYRRNHIHHCTMGIWCDWEAQGTRITQNLLHDNQKPSFAKQLKGGMMSQDLFVEVGHGPTLIDNNVLLSDASLRFATQGVAMVHNLICGALTCVGGGTGLRYTPYHIPHRTEVMGFMTILHGDNRFYNNIFVQKWPSEPFVTLRDSSEGRDEENREVGTHVWDEYPAYEEWIQQFDMDTDTPNMKKLEPAHNSHLPIWAKGNVYLGGAKCWKKENGPLWTRPALPLWSSLRQRGGPGSPPTCTSSWGTSAALLWTPRCWAGPLSPRSALRTLTVRLLPLTGTTSASTGARTSCRGPSRLPRRGKRPFGDFPLKAKRQKGRPKALGRPFLRWNAFPPGDQSRNSSRRATPNSRAMARSSPSSMV